MPIVRLQGNDNLRGIWSVFRERGYDTKWIYGGYGYFDNMNAYFSGNGFTVVDRTVMQPEEITFSNIWGVCDENLFARAIKEADASHAAGKPFFNFVLTTSNHRPYTYPDGRISIPSKSGRNGGVMYADYSIGKFMEEARKHPWFDDTVFVFVADHGASSSGRERRSSRGTITFRLSFMRRSSSNRSATISRSARSTPCRRCSPCFISSIRASSTARMRSIRTMYLVCS